MEIRFPGSIDYIAVLFVSFRMRLFSQGKKITYRGQRDLSEIARFVLKELENLVCPFWL